MGADGRLQYEIGADASGLAKAVDGAISKIGGLGLKVAGLATGAAVFGGLAASIKSVMTAASFEQTQVQFRNLVGDVKAADAALQALRVQADATPFEFAELAQSATGLIAAKVSVDDLGRTVEALGNLASGATQPLQRMVQPYQQILTLGKVTYEDIKQFAEAGVPIFDALAKVMQTSGTEAAAAVQDGAVSVDQFKAAILSLGGAGGSWGKMMAAQSKTTIGLFSSLKDAVDGVFLAFGQPINDAIKPILTAAINLAGELRPIFAGLGQQVANVVTAMHDFVAHAKQGGGVVAALAQAMGEVFQTLAVYGKAFGQVLLTAAAGLGVTLTTALTPVFQWLQAKVDVFSAGFADGVATALGDVLDQLPFDMGKRAADSLQDVAFENREKVTQRSKDADNVDFNGATRQAMEELAATVQLTMKEARNQLDVLRFRATEQGGAKGQAGGSAVLPIATIKTPAENAAQALQKVAYAADQASRSMKANANAEQRGGALAEVDILEAQAAGHDKKAQRLERELKLQQLISQYKKELNATDEQALDLATRRLNAEEDLERRRNGLRRKIRGHSQGEGPVRNFGGLDEHEDNQHTDKPADRSRMRTPGLDEFSRLQNRRQDAFPRPGQPNAAEEAMRRSSISAGQRAGVERAKESRDKQTAQATDGNSVMLGAMLGELKTLNQKMAILEAA